jgi:hypothetical protein
MYQGNNTVCIDSDVLDNYKKTTMPLHKKLLKRQFPTIEFISADKLMDLLMMEALTHGKLDVKSRYVAAQILPDDPPMLLWMYGPLTTVIFHLDNFVTWPWSTSWKDLTRSLDGLNAGVFECSICCQAVNNLVACNQCHHSICPECKIKTGHCPYCRHKPKGTSYVDSFHRTTVANGLHLIVEHSDDKSHQ